MRPIKVSEPFNLQQLLQMNIAIHLKHGVRAYHKKRSEHKGGYVRLKEYINNRGSDPFFAE